MTVVAALITRDGAWMGCDSLTSDESTCATIATPKAGRFGDKLIGFAGSWDGQRVLTIAKRNYDLTWDEILFRSGPLDQNLSLLCVEDGRLYLSQSSKECIEFAKKDGTVYGAIGSGDAVALGSLHRDHEDRESLREALKASAAHVPTVRGPFRILSL